jgi:hypothetical protein
MKIELVKETKWDGTIWYAIYKSGDSSKSGDYITGSGNYDFMLEVYNAAKADPENFFKIKKEVLQSDESSVSSQETN